jgi:hypothetical protein
MIFLAAMDSPGPDDSNGGRDMGRQVGGPVTDVALAQAADNVLRVLGMLLGNGCCGVGNRSASCWVRYTRVSRARVVYAITPAHRF